MSKPITVLKLTPESITVDLVQLVAQTDAPEAERLATNPPYGKYLAKDYLLSYGPCEGEYAEILADRVEAENPYQNFNIVDHF